MEQDNTKICSVCDGRHDADKMLELDGKEICFPCAIAVSWLDMKAQEEKEEQMARDYEDALWEQQQDRRESDLFAEVGIKCTKEGNLYYPDEEHANVFHIAQARKEFDR